MRHLKHTFNRLDSDGDGVVTSEDVRNLIGCGDDADASSSHRIFQELSRDGEAPVSFEDFSEYFRNMADPTPAVSRVQTNRSRWTTFTDYRSVFGTSPSASRRVSMLDDQEEDAARRCSVVSMDGGSRVTFNV